MTRDVVFYLSPLDLLRERSFGASTARLLLKFDPSRFESSGDRISGTRAAQDRRKRTLKSRWRLSRFRGDLAKFFRAAREKGRLR